MINDQHRRRSIRLQGYDYSQPGAYFVTIVTRDRECLFGEIVEGAVSLSPYGAIVQECWAELPHHFAHVELDASVAMPNHVHGIIVLMDVGAQHAALLRNPGHPAPQFAPPQLRVAVGSVGTMVRSFKSVVTKRINEIRGTPGAALWQRNYYEHVVRDEDELDHIRRYILDNPVQWALDRENPEAASVVGAQHAAPLRDEISVIFGGVRP
ncbi:MAG: transposase [Chloroflexota bacterium]|nr:transposase [Chloroflexota bacterium]